MKFCALLLTGITLLLLTPACKKDSTIAKPATRPVLSVKLNAEYLNDSKVDSAFAIWKTNNQEQKIKMLVRNDSLIVNMSEFNEGNGKMTVYIYSNKKFNNHYPSHWILYKDISLQKSNGIQYNGPSSFFDVNWFPRVDLFDGIGDRAIIGLKPEDSYFLIKDVHPGIINLIVDKSFWKTIGGVQGVGQGIWECATGCTNEEGDVENTNYFDFIPGQIGNKTWNHIEVIVFYQDTPTSGWSISLNYDPS